MIKEQIVLYNESDSTYISLSQSLETWIIEYVILTVFIIQRFWDGKTFLKEVSSAQKLHLFYQKIQ